MTRAELIEALETAQGADADLLSDAWELLAQSGPAFRCWACQVVDKRGMTNAGVFGRLLDANAYLDAAMMLATGDNAKFIALSDAMVALEKAGWPNGTWHEHLPRFIAAACLRAGGE